MKKKTKAVLISISAFILLLCCLRAYPILADDKELIFTPIKQDDPTAYKELLRISRSEGENLTLTADLEERMELALEKPQLVDFTAALGVIKKLKEKEVELPPEWEDKDFLSERLVIALKNDIHYLYQNTKENTNLTEQILLSSLDASEFEKQVGYLKVRALEIFTYQENKTFNTLWKRIEDFEANPAEGIQIEVDPREFGFDNFFGKFLLACVTPSLSKTIESINEMESNQAEVATP